MTYPPQPPLQYAAPQSPDQPPKRKSKRWPWILGAIVALLAIAGITVGNEDSKDSSSTAVTATAAAAPTSNARSAAEIQQSQAAAASRAAAVSQAAVAKEAAAKAAEAAKLDRATYEVLGERDYALLVKNPDAAKGRKIVVHGYVAQFDSATGTSTFRAYTGNAPAARKSSFDVNTIVNGNPALLANIVEDDFFTMYAEVMGSKSYETTMGGNQTAPVYQANIIDVTG